MKLMAEQQLIIRDATTEDLLALTNLMKDLGYPTTLEEMGLRFGHIFNHSEYKTFVVCLNEEVVGWEERLFQEWKPKMEVLDLILVGFMMK